MLDADGEVTARSRTRLESESLKVAPEAVEASRVLIAYSRRAPEDARIMRDDLIMSHMWRELLGAAAEQSVN